MNIEDGEQKIPDSAGKEKNSPFGLVDVAWNMGFSIAVPIVVLALLGRFADKHFGTSPFLLLLGVALSIFISVFLVWKKMSKIINRR